MRHHMFKMYLNVIVVVPPTFQTSRVMLSSTLVYISL